jgi:hypothetical protein
MEPVGLVFPRPPRQLGARAICHSFRRSGTSQDGEHWHFLRALAFRVDTVCSEGCFTYAVLNTYQAMGVAKD